MSFLRSSITALAAAALAFSVSAAPRLFGVNPFNNGTESTPMAPNALTPADYGFYEFSPSTGAIIATRIITVPGRTITGAVALTLDPTTNIAYAVVKATGVSGGRLLVTINLDTAVGTEIGNLGDNFSSLAFRSDGQLFGVTGDGATVPETLYLINKATAAKTLATALGNGADGEVIAFNPNDGALYHFSGGTVVFERVQATPPYAVTPIVTGLTGVGEVFGAVWDPSRNAFLVSDISSTLTVVNTAGTVTSTVGTFPTDIRGLILLPDAFVAEYRVVPALDNVALIALLLSVGVIGFASVRSLQRRR
jgi:hypothetical protein